jgi:hypothetical protein
MDINKEQKTVREDHSRGRRQPLPVQRQVAVGGSKQTYLDRDALKVLGTSDYSGRRMKATAAFFYLNTARKNGGGTGHTLRLCEAEKVPYFLSADWLAWPE